MFSQLHEATYNYKKTEDSLYDPTKLAIHSIVRPAADLISNCHCGHTFKEVVSFYDVVQFIDEENIVTYVDFDCGNTFYTETPTKNGRITRGRKNNFKSCEKPKCIPCNDQHQLYSSIKEQHTRNI